MNILLSISGASGSIYGIRLLEEMIKSDINVYLIVSNSANKIFEIDEHIIGSAAGILSDARILIERAQLMAQQHRITYDSPIEP